MQRKTLSVPRQRWAPRTDHRQTAARDSLMRDAFRSLTDALGHAADPRQYDITRSDAQRATKPWGPMMDVLEQNLREARGLRGTDRDRVRYAVRRVLHLMEALVMGEYAVEERCHLELALSEQRLQERADEAQFRHAADPECPVNNERLLMAFAEYEAAMRDVTTDAALRLARVRAGR